MSLRLSWRRRLGAYRQLSYVAARTELVYRSNFLMSIVGLLIQILLFKIVWTAVYAGRESAAGVDLETMIAYVTLTRLQVWFLLRSASSVIPRRVREGKIAADLARPVGLLQQDFAGQVGRTWATIPFALLALPLAVIVGGAQPPASVVAALAYLMSLILAFLIAVLTATALGLLAFWTFEVGGILFVYRHISTFFAGALIPLWLMPTWLRTIAELLPFQATAYTPVSIYLGRLAGQEMVSALAVQCFWVAAVYSLGVLAWRRALHRVVVQGG